MHLFEFMDLKTTPVSLKRLLRESLEFVLDANKYYDFVCAEIENLHNQHHYNQIIELGAGQAPLSKRLSEKPWTSQLTLVPCDLYPIENHYKHLQTSYRNIKPILKPIDFSKPHDWPKNSLLVISASFHHIHPKYKEEIVTTILKNGDLVIAEPLRQNFLSYMISITNFFTILFFSLFNYQQGWLKRVFWCIPLPIAPLIFVWEGFVSALRQSYLKDWSNLEDSKTTYFFQFLFFKRSQSS
ncbi:MAG: hypothetical protein KDD58_14985 [Bdellovibrionales bacterium]|nr:hypothetical protein [Bdellovibrionales bacterium]